MEAMRTGLIMEGGAMRGMFTCGVTDVMMEHGIIYDGAIGVSAGAAFGCNYKSGQIGRAIRYNKAFCNDKRYAGLGSLLRTGNLYNVEFCYHTVPRELDLWDEEAFRTNPMEFYATCTEVTTGEPVYHRLETGADEDIEWLRASASMPLVSKVVEIGEHHLLDGGVADSIPIRYFESLGYNRNVIILTQPLGFVKQKNEYLPAIRIALRKYPALIRAMENRHERYNETIAYIREQELAGDVYVIRPPETLNIGSREKNPEELERVYQIGRRAGEECAEAVQQFLKPVEKAGCEVRMKRY